MLLALLLVFLLTPMLSKISGSELSFEYFQNPMSLFLLGVFSFLVGIVAGLYPAFVLSSYKPVDVLKGRFSKTSSGTLFRKGMVIVQFVASITLIVGTYTVYQQISFMQNQKLGLNIDQTLVVETPAVADSTYENKYQVFKETLLGFSEISSFASSTSVPGRQPNWNAGGIRLLSQTNDEANQYRVIMMDDDFIPGYGLEVVAGRGFSDKVVNENRNVMMNESAARLMGFKDVQQSINDQIYFWGDTFRIVGVLKDYHQESLKKSVEPLIFRYYSAPGGFYSIKMDVANVSASIGKIEKVWKEFYPGSPFSYFFLDDHYNEQYKADQQFGKAFGLFSALAIFVACLGLFLSSKIEIARFRSHTGKSISSTSAGLDSLAAEIQQEEDPAGDHGGYRSGPPVRPGPGERGGPRGHEGKRERDHPAREHDQVEDVAGFEVERQHLHQDGNQHGVDEEQPLRAQLEREKEEEQGAQRRHQEHVELRLPELDFLEAS